MSDITEVKRMGVKARRLAVLLGLMLILILPTLLRAEEAGKSESDVAREAQNPLANLTSIPLQNNTNFGLGRHDRTQSILNIQPVIPFSLGGNWNLITRTILPIQEQPKLWKNSGEDFGLGDMTFSAQLTPAVSHNLTWGIGPILSFPTGTINSIKTEKWGAGPSGALVYTLRAWVGGVLINNIWSFAGESDRQDVNQMLIQPFINYNLSKGWYLTSSPAITANWQASAKNAWTVPVGGGVGKVISIHGQLLNIGAQGYVYPVHPDNQRGPEWAVQTTLQWLFPK